MSSGQDDLLAGGFTIPKKRRGGADQAPTSGGDDAQSPSSRPSRKVRSAEELTPELEAMSKLLTQLYARADASPFREPVDWKALGLFNYPQIIKRPMDLGTVKRKLTEGKYKTVFEAAEDVRLIWTNCMTYNPEGTDFHKLGQHLSSRFEEKYEKLCAKNGGKPSPSKTGGRRKKYKRGGSSAVAEDDDRKPAARKKPGPKPGAARRSSSRSSTPTPRSSGRNTKRKKSVYAEAELEDTDTDDLMTSGEEEAFEKRRQKRIARKKKKKVEVASAEEEQVADATSVEEVVAVKEQRVIYEIDAPPPGHLNCLWYSKEEFRHVFVLEKVLGWKTRPVFKIEACEPIKVACEPSKTEGDGDAPLKTDGDAPMKTEEVALKPPPLMTDGEKIHTIDFDEAIKIKDKAIVDTGNDFRKRREISRINPANCPYIQKIAADQELTRSKRDGSDPKFKVVKSANEREEVFLVKWRGRSHIHCSWERQCDIEKYDQSVQAGAARGKISRFLQNQALTLGHDWQKVQEDGRKSQANIVTHHTHTSHHPQSPGRPTDGSGSNNPPTVNATGEGEPDGEIELDEEEYFSPLYLEVDRIVGCDENELDMDVLARQRALNLRAEREALKRREKEDDEEEKWLKGEQAEDEDADDVKQSASAEDQKEEEWDPEDNVRYIVRWKGLQLTEATWEYWIDIKRDFVDEVDDFWLRQQAPSDEEVEEITEERHPHPRSFKKMKESPIFGISEKDRPIAKLEGLSEVDYEASSDTDNESVLKLRSYQLEGVNWLLWNWYNRRSCILADEMGLGKTIQTIGLLQQLEKVPKVNVRGPFLIVAPLSLVSQWESETKAWAPDVNAVVYHGSADARDFLVKEEFYYTDQFETRATAQSLKRKHITKFNLLITTYEVAMKDANVLSKIHWKALIVDEAHRLKNIKSRLFEDLASVPRDFCLLLTGTPLQNSTEELWALLHFADPKAFASREEFTNKFGQLQDAEQVANLHTVLRPYLLRRVKEDVEKSLPPKEETILEVTLTPIQKQFYKAIYEKNTGFLYKGTKASNAPSLMNVMMELRKCCNHPFLIRGAEDRIIDDAAEAEHKSFTPNEQLYKQIDYAKLTGEQLIKSSGKFVLLSKLLPKLHANGHKVLIFSQMVRVLDLLQELVQLNHYRYERLDGTTSASARNAAVDRFKRDSFKRFVMLLSTRAGGLGLNLTAADTVIIFDSDWNPQNDLQAMARAHRIGQTRSVRVYRLLTAKTYEMHMFHSASLKLGLDRAVLAHQRQNTNPDESSSKRKSKAEREEQAKEIDELLKKGAYDVFNEEGDEEAQKFMDTDIDQLLEQSSRKVTYGEAATSTLSSGLGSFSKASFVADTGEGDGKDVDLDDPDFWSKAVGLEAPPEEQDETLALIIGDGSKRERKKVQTFDFGAEAEAEWERERLAMIAQQKQEEKEEKERKKLEKFLKKEAEREAREKKKREAMELKEKLRQKRLQAIKDQKDRKAKEVKKKVREVKIVYNDRKTDRKRALKRAQHEDPVFERVSQAWDTSQRNRVVSAILRFGFGRFCKVRHESNFTSLPIQDVEVFARSYVYQLGLQAAFTLMSDVDCGEALPGDMDAIVQKSLHNVLGSFIGNEGRDFSWICQAILSSLCTHMRMKSNDAFLRMPLCLAEPSFLYDLRQGVAMRSLHRISFLSRLNSIIEEALDRTISDVGPEQMGQRGCLTRDYSTLDMDLKARYVTTEELMYALSIKLSVSLESYRHTCPPWWDRSCDLGLVLGTFFHGLGNYEAMRSDKDLPFASKIKSYVRCSNTEAESYHSFGRAADATKCVFDTALDTMKRKFQEQTHAAVAAVFAATKESGDNKPAYSVQTQKMDDDDIVSMARLKDATVKAFRSTVDPSSKAGKKSSLKYSLPLPDSKHLDYLLVQIVENIESNSRPLEQPPKSQIQASSNTLIKAMPGWRDNMNWAGVISTNRDVLHKANILINSRKDTGQSRILFAGSLSGVDKKPQDDCADFFLGAASKELATIAVGADSSRYQRGPCVPLIVTRFGLGAILLAEDSAIDSLAKSFNDNSSSQDEVDQQQSKPTSVGEENKVHAHPEATAASGANEDEKKPPATTSGADADNKKPSAVGPVWQYIMNDSTLRASLCTAVLYGGYPCSPSNDSFVNISAELRLELNRNPALLPPIPFSCLSSPVPMSNCPFFSMEDAFGPLLKSFGIDFSENKDSLDEYLRQILLPRCLRLCLMLAGEHTKIADNQGNTDVYLGRPSLEQLSPLPDPLIPLESHSEEAMAHAYAILRRTRLMRSIRFIVGGGVPLNVLTEFLHGPVWRSQAMGVPVWWCPWIHDLGLLVHAALYGLGSITNVLPLQQSFIEQHVRETFIDGTADRKPALPKCFLDQLSKEDIDAWVQTHSKQFPTFHVVEHRLALICSHLTVGTDYQYDNVPMFDEGGWPMVEDVSAPGFLADMKTSGTRCLLSDYEN